jgi:hypothetical protein
MMASYLKYKSLTAQIRTRAAGVKPSTGVGVSAASLVRKIPTNDRAGNLLLAVGIGFIIGELTKRQPTKSPGTANKPRAASPFTTALNLITSVRTLYMALPIAWMMKSIHQPSTVGSSARTVNPSGSGADSVKTNI